MKFITGVLDGFGTGMVFVMLINAFSLLNLFISIFGLFIFYTLEYIVLELFEEEKKNRGKK